MKLSIKQQKRDRRHARIRARVRGNAEKPRLAVFRSNKHIYAQIIDDETAKTLVSSSDVALDSKGTKSERASSVGKDIATKAKKKGIERIVFDRGGFNFAGRVKLLADSAREDGLSF